MRESRPTEMSDSPRSTAPRKDAESWARSATCLSDSPRCCRSRRITFPIWGPGLRWPFCSADAARSASRDGGGSCGVGGRFRHEGEATGARLHGTDISVSVTRFWFTAHLRAAALNTPTARLGHCGPAGGRWRLRSRTRSKGDWLETARVVRLREPQEVALARRVPGRGGGHGGSGWALVGGCPSVWARRQVATFGSRSPARRIRLTRLCWATTVRSSLRRTSMRVFSV